MNNYQWEGLKIVDDDKIIRQRTLGSCSQCGRRIMRGSDEYQAYTWDYTNHATVLFLCNTKCATQFFNDWKRIRGTVEEFKLLNIDSLNQEERAAFELSIPSIQSIYDEWDKLDEIPEDEKRL